MRILITGAHGQLGVEAAKRAPKDAEMIVVGRADVDLRDAEALRAFLMECAPTHILHGAAWTAVDAAESDLEGARAVNARASEVIAECAKELGARALYVSTDFVFGDGHDRPIPTGALPAPLNAYGLTKREGEVAFLTHLGDDALIVRTAWVYSSHGANFVRTMLRLMSERTSLNVVVDQVGTPTWAGTLAEASLALLLGDFRGTWHVTDAGVASWYDFAVAIYEEGRERGLVPHEVAITPICATEYPTPARRPHFSLLDKKETWLEGVIRPVHWRENLRAVLDEIVKARG